MNLEINIFNDSYFEIKFCPLFNNSYEFTLKIQIFISFFTPA